MSAADQWNWTDERGKPRTGGIAELRRVIANGAIPATALVRREGMDDWAAASTFSELASGSEREGPTDVPTMDPTTTDEQTDVRAPPRMDSTLPEPLPKGKMPTLLGLGGNDPRVSAARAAILAHEAAGSKPGRKEARDLDDDSIFEDDALETQVRRESSRTSAAGGRAGGPPKSRGPVTGKPLKAPPKLTDRPPLTLPYGGAKGLASSGTTKPPPPPPKAGPTTPPPRKGAEAAHGRPPTPTPKPTLTSGLRPNEAPISAAPSLLALASARLASPTTGPNDRVEPTAKLPISELLDGEETGREAATAPSAPPEASAARRSQPSIPLLAASLKPPRSDVAEALASLEAGVITATLLPDEAVESLVEDDPAPARSRRLAGSVTVPVSSLVGAGGALIVMVVAAFLAGRATTAGGLGRAGALYARAGVGRAAMAARDAVPPAPKPCWVARQPVRWAPEVEKGVPFDVVATKDGSFAVGFARGARDAVGVSVDPTSGVLTEQLAEPTRADVERVTPLPVGGKAFAVMASGSESVLRGALQLPDDRGGLVGVHQGSLATLDRPDAAPTSLFSLGEDAGVEALRAQSAGTAGFGLVMRRGGAVWGGWLGAEHKPAGALGKIAGSGGPVGKPMTGWNGRELAVVFADRPAEDAPWQIRLGRAKPPVPPASTVVVALPKGGPGGDAFAPGIAGLPDGRWLLVWTEGAAGGRAIRAQTLAADFTPVGDPIALSPPAGNFGQGIVAISGAYAATVFLSKGRSSYELWGAILQCG